jgi:D-amino-acid dehydrogenase
MTHVLVAGAGIVGISSAIWLQRAGCRVTVVDRAGPASGTSHGNAGVLGATSVIPVTTPGLLGKVPGMLLGPESPLFLRWSYLPKLLPFLRRYLGHATDAHVDLYAKAMSSLLFDTVEQHKALAADTPAAAFIEEEDYCIGYATHADFEADGYGRRKRDALGARYEIVDDWAYAEFDPIFGNAFQTVVRNKDHGRVSDPGAYVKALADHFVEQGGEIVIATVEDVHMEDGRVTALETSEGRMGADKIVLALGVWSKAIAHKLGVPVPMESERGYHIELMNPSALPKCSMMIGADKFIIGPMKGRIRAAGLVEFGGLKAGPSRAPLDLLRRRCEALLPDVTWDSVVEWLGHRPAPADSLPLIGAATDRGDAYCAFGHQHVGLTGGAKTGRLIAEMIAGQAPNIDLAPFDPAKYRRS